MSKASSFNFTLDLKREEDIICFSEWLRNLFQINTPLPEILHLHLVRLILGIL